MDFKANFSSLTKLLTILFGLCAQGTSVAQVISPSGQEMKYKYTATFESPIDAEEQTDEERAELHASHLFGLFHAPKMVARFQIPVGTGGIGGPQAPAKIKILSSKIQGDVVRIEYSNSGKMLLHRLAAEALLKKGFLVVPLPTDTYKIYDEKCTDEHYSSFGDFWYFYDPFRAGCEHLAKAPLAADVEISLAPSNPKKIEKELKLSKLRGDNDNGDIFSIYVIKGFETDTREKEDVARENFAAFNEHLLNAGFTEIKKTANQNWALHVYGKDLVLKNGRKIKVELKHLLIDSAVGSKSKIFAQFFKEAVETADVIAYGGHSGLGGNLDIPSLEEKAGRFQFNEKKHQVFFFDSCSSYSYYLQHFAKEKKKSKIDVITNGLSSYFHTMNSVMEPLLEQLMSTETEDVPWLKILNKMEAPLQSDTYLLNVGGV